MEALKRLIERHLEYTNSPRAEWILDNWSTMLPKFVKVFPHEYKRVLGVPRSAEKMTSTVMPSVAAQATQEVRQ
jgi:glutamate synthase domain-containing protein 3